MNHLSPLSDSDKVTWLTNLLDFLPLTVLHLDREGTLLSAQGRHLEHLGLPPTINTNISALKAAPWLAPVAYDLQQALAGQTVTTRLKLAGIPFSVHCLPLQYHYQEKQNGALIVLEDISEHEVLTHRLQIALDELHQYTTHSSLCLLGISGNNQSIIHATLNTEHLLGYPPNTLIKLPLSRLFPSSSIYEHFKKQLAPYLQQGLPFHIDQWLKRCDGSSIYCHITISISPVDTVQYDWLLEDITTLQQNRLLKEALWAHQHEIAILLDTKLCIQGATPACHHLMGYSPNTLTRKKLYDLDSGRQEAHFYEKLLAVFQQEGHWQGTLWLRHQNGTLCYYQARLHLLDDQTSAGPHNLYLLFLNEYSYRHSSISDPLTELPGAVLFQHDLKKMHNLARRHGKRFAILLISLDNMHDINLHYGYLIGDQFLCKLGEIVRATVRDSDGVARLDGDTFVVSLEEIRETRHVSMIGEMILFKLTQPLHIEQYEVRGQVSIGIVVYPEDQGDTQTLLERGRQALYRARVQGGDRCFFYNEDLQNQHKS